MSLQAIDALENAYDASRELLWPFETAQWVRLAVIAFFVAGLGGIPVGGNLNIGAPAEMMDVRLGALGGQVTLIALAVVALVIILTLLYIGSVMEFVLVDYLRSRNPQPLRSFGRWRWPGTRLFGFRIVLFTVLAAVVALAIVIVVALAGPGSRLISVVVAVLLLLVAVPLILVVNGFTTVFVVPIALDTGDGVLASWRRLIIALRANPMEFGVYLLVGLILSGIGTAFISAIAGLVGLVAVFPIGALGVLLLFAFGPSPVALLFAVPLVLSALALLLAVAAVIRVPVLTYLRYYAIYTLAGVTDYDVRPKSNLEPAVHRID